MSHIFLQERHTMFLCTKVHTTGLLLPADAVIARTFTVSGNTFLAVSMIFFFHWAQTTERAPG